MAWRENKQVGIAAAVLLVAAVVIVVWYVMGSSGSYEYFICESTGKVFKVKADPNDSEYLSTYAGVAPGSPVRCKIDGQDDAYKAMKDADGNWIKVPEQDLGPAPPPGTEQ